MSHYPRPPAWRRYAIGLVVALGFAAALSVLLRFRHGDCGGAFEASRDVAAPLLLWATFAIFELRAAHLGPGRAARMLKRAGFAVLVAGLALALLVGPRPVCGEGLDPRETALLVAVVGAGTYFVTSLRLLRR